MAEQEHSSEPSIEFEFGTDYFIDGSGTRWALSCQWPPTGADTAIPAFLCIDQERRKRAWDTVKLTNQWTGGTEEDWQIRQKALMDARAEADRAIEARKRNKEHPNQYWDPTTREWVKREITAAVTRAPIAGAWACPGLGTSCCMSACDGGRACMMQAGGGSAEVA